MDFAVQCLQNLKIAFVGDSLIAELFVGLGDILSGDSSEKSNVNFHNWAERWNTAYRYNKILMKRNISLQCTKSSECYLDINDNCMKCIKKYASYDFIIYGNAHIISEPLKWHNILHPIHKMTNTILVTQPIILNNTLSYNSTRYYNFIMNRTKYQRLHILDWYKATDNDFGKKERLDAIHSNRNLSRIKAMFLIQRICHIPLFSHL